jgi:hypothetical protein
MTLQKHKGNWHKNSDTHHTGAYEVKRYGSAWLATQSDSTMRHARMIGIYKTQRAAIAAIDKETA